MSKANNTFFSNKVQEIHSTPKGIITESSNTIIELTPGDNIFDIHPFFESLKHELKSGKESNLAFPCVQLDINEIDLICDITIKKEREFLAILLFDYSKHYEHLHEAAQEKKTAMLNEQAHELNSKHSEEKKIYLEFLQNLIDNKIIKELETVVLVLEKLKKTTLDQEQSALVNTVKQKIGSLHMKVVQIIKA